MKPSILTIVLVLLLTNLFAQSSIDSSKAIYQKAKTQIENMLTNKETASYEKAIFIIENAFYDNNVNKNDYDFAMQNHINNINEIIKINYDFNSTNPKPTLLHSREELEELYKKALTNWAIYTYITSNAVFINSQNVLCHRKYSYSSTDPMASDNWANTQVVKLNNTHQGNCFALASFFKILSDRLKSEATLCTAPSHIYINHKDNKGISYNVELGSKNFPGTGMISVITYSTDEAVKNNISQRDLTTEQSIALCLVYLAKGYEHKFNNTKDDFILQCANKALQYDDRNLNAMLLKAEYLENKLIALHKPISQLQLQTDFKNYQTLIANLYNLGYREMPLGMKNTLIKSYRHEKIEAKPIDLTKRVASLSWGLFDERHELKPTERIGNTLFNTKTKKITSFAKDQTLYNNYNFDPVVFAWNIDPMAHAYPGLSPYSFAANNPIMFTDHKGAYVEGTDGKPVTYKMLTNGKIQWSANASEDAKRVGNAMLETKTGKKVFTQMQKAKYPITLVIDEERTDKMDRFAETDPTYTKDRKTLEKATITFFMKTIKDFIENPQKDEDMDAQSKQMKDKKFNEDDIIGVNGSHEGTHAADPLAIKDIADQYYFGKDVDPEARPEKNEDSDIKERIKQKEQKEAPKKK